MTDYLVKFNGTIGTNEEFSHSLVVTESGAGSEAALLADIGTAFAGAKAAHNIFSLLPDTTAYSSVSAARILDLGTGALNAKVETALVHVGSGAASTALPPQCSLVVSLQGGAKANGTPYRGRFHTPAPSKGSTESGYITTTAQAAWRDFWGKFLDDLASLPSLRTTRIWSRTDGLTVPIASIRVGRVIDTIRSRRTDLPEEYVSRGVSQV